MSVSIQTLKYNYRATGIVEALNSQGFTIYRSPGNKLRQGKTIIWRVSDKGVDAFDDRLFRIVNRAIIELVENRQDLIWTGGVDVEPFWGYGRILSLDLMDSSAYLFEKC